MITQIAWFFNINKIASFFWLVLSCAPPNSPSNLLDSPRNISLSLICIQQSPTPSRFQQRQRDAWNIYELPQRFHEANKINNTEIKSFQFSPLLLSCRLPFFCCCKWDQNIVCFISPDVKGVQRTRSNHTAPYISVIFYPQPFLPPPRFPC